MTKVIGTGNIYRGEVQVVTMCGSSAARIWLRCKLVGAVGLSRLAQTPFSSSGLERELLLQPCAATAPSPW